MYTRLELLSECYRSAGAHLHLLGAIGQAATFAFECPG